MLQSEAIVEAFSWRAQMGLAIQGILFLVVVLAWVPEYEIAYAQAPTPTAQEVAPNEATGNGGISAREIAVFAALAISSALAFLTQAQRAWRLIANIASPLKNLWRGAQGGERRRWELRRDQFEEQKKAARERVDFLQERCLKAPDPERRKEYEKQLEVAEADYTRVIDDYVRPKRRGA